MLELLSLYCTASSRSHSLTVSKKYDIEVSICFNLRYPFIFSNFLPHIVAVWYSKREMSVVVSYMQFEQRICELHIYRRCMITQVNREHTEHKIIKDNPEEV
jgi:hypothetical protein